jgi:hypothetical protein
MKTTHRLPLRKIESLFATCPLILLVRGRGPDGKPLEDCSFTDAAGVIESAKGSGFARVDVRRATIACRVRGGWEFIGFRTVEAARRRLTPRAFVRHFSDR